jgi:cyclopropane-fatty-acyl-phospholipid synthase
MKKLKPVPENESDSSSAELSETSQAAIEFLSEVLRDYSGVTYALRLWNGTVLQSPSVDAPAFTLVINHPAALQRMFLADSDLGAGEAYIFGDIDVEGDIAAAYDFWEALQASDINLWKRFKLQNLLRKLPSPQHQQNKQRLELRGAIHSRQRDRQAIGYHYDLPESFYKLWLDSNLVYSCAYFTSPEQTLDAAQEQKLDYLCRKLRLKTGEKLLDIGCGWGGLIVHAAKKYGVQALGITISESQARVAKERIRRLGIEDCCQVQVSDYRDIKPETPFDKVVSVGMFEHVGQNNLPTYFGRIWELTKAGGVFLNHGIARDRSGRHHSRFAERYVFPDGELVPLSTALRSAEDCGFELRDVENLREHYVYTLQRWYKNLCTQVESARRVVDEITYRIWRLYVAGAAHEFAVGRLHLFQCLFSKPALGKSGLPLTRTDWYVPEAA